VIINSSDESSQIGNKRIPTIHKNNILAIGNKSI